jgi:transcriptional regulator with XRE-family HTH domain
MNSKNSKNLIARVSARMRERGDVQKDVANACQICQPHLSKVLNKKVKLAKKTSQRLERWLNDDVVVHSDPPSEILGSLGAKIANLRPSRRMQIMQLLQAINHLLDR